jgi:hypothetical protein
MKRDISSLGNISSAAFYKVQTGIKTGLRGREIGRIK